MDYDATSQNNTYTHNNASVDELKISPQTDISNTNQTNPSAPKSWVNKSKILLLGFVVMLVLSSTAFATFSQGFKLPIADILFGDIPGSGSECFDNPTHYMPSPYKYTEGDTKSPNDNDDWILWPIKDGCANPQRLSEIFGPLLKIIDNNDGNDSNDVYITKPLSEGGFYGFTFNHITAIQGYDTARLMQGDYDDLTEQKLNDLHYQGKDSQSIEDCNRNAVQMVFDLTGRDETGRKVAKPNAAGWSAKTGYWQLDITPKYKCDGAYLHQQSLGAAFIRVVPKTIPVACGQTCDASHICQNDSSCVNGTCTLLTCQTNGQLDQTKCAGPCSLINNVTCSSSCDATNRCPADNSCISGKCTLNSCLTNNAYDATKCSSLCTPIINSACGGVCDASRRCPNNNTCINGICTLNACLEAGVCDGPCKPILACGNSCDINQALNICESGNTCKTVQGQTVCTANICLSGGNFDTSKCVSACIPVTPLSCVNLSSSKLTPQRGDTVVYTCNGQGTNASYANFRILKNNEVISPSDSYVVLDGNKRANWSVNLPQNMAEGSYKVQCQICSDNSSSNQCTNWSLAQ